MSESGSSSSLSRVAVDNSFVMQVRPKRRAPITQVLMVGGATRMPAFNRFVRNMTGLEAKGAAVDPDEVRPSSCAGEAPEAFCFACCCAPGSQHYDMLFMGTRSKLWWCSSSQHALGPVLRTVSILTCRSACSELSVSRDALAAGQHKS